MIIPFKSLNLILGSSLNSKLPVVKCGLSNNFWRAMLLNFGLLYDWHFSIFYIHLWCGNSYGLSGFLAVKCGERLNSWFTTNWWNINYDLDFSFNGSFIYGWSCEMMIYKWKHCFCEFTLSTVQTFYLDDDSYLMIHNLCIISFTILS